MSFIFPQIISITDATGNPSISDTTGIPATGDICDLRDPSSPIFRAMVATKTFRGPYVCGICGNAFQKGSALKRHMHVHVNEQHSSQIYKCTICSKTFGLAKDYECHIQNNHSRPQALKCSICGCFRPVNQLCNLISPFKCDSCLVGFNGEVQLQAMQSSAQYYNMMTSSPSLISSSYRSLQVPSTSQKHPIVIEHKPELQNTEQSHQVKQESVVNQQTILVISKKEKPYKCKDCDRSFTHNTTLAMHRKLHSGQYKYKCEFCDKPFYLAEYYTRHRRVHTKEKPYLCDFCDKRFSQSNTLTQHRRIHTGEKPYECQVCGRQFSVKDYLNKHLRTHTGEKPYECQSCGKRYSQSSGLKQHEKGHYTAPPTIQSIV